MKRLVVLHTITLVGGVRVDTQHGSCLVPSALLISTTADREGIQVEWPQLEALATGSPGSLFFFSGTESPI